MAIKRMPPKKRQYTEGVDQEKAQKRAPPPEGTLRPRYEEPKRTLSFGPIPRRGDRSRKAWTRRKLRREETTNQR